MARKIGVDIGGTFTDIVLYDDQAGSVEAHKVPTDAERPAKSCIEAIKSIVASGDWPDVESFLYSTTVALNALLERKGGKIGLLCTKGHRDTMELARGTRGDPYNLFWRPKRPLAPRKHRLGIEERIIRDGSVLTALNEAEVKEAAAFLEAEGVEAVAVAYLHSYANPDHESRSGELLRDGGYTGEITLSHELSGEYREYERTSTTLINAYIQGRIKQDLNDLESGLAELGFKGSLFTTRSGGGAMDLAEAIARSFETINSGPVAGADGAAQLARELELEAVIAADVGGTSFDTAVIQDGRVPVLYEGAIELMPIQSPWVDVRSIGAGGGSIAWIDGGGLMQTGPESAGAYPGPACYSRGGEKATVMDATVHLGMLGITNLSGDLQLDEKAAETALEPLAKSLNMSVRDVARGAIRIVSAKMADAIREMTIESGKDPRQMSLLAFGGAGPLLATNLAKELGIGRIVVPPFAGNFSAWGLLGADLVRAASCTKIMPLSDDCLPEVNGLLEGMFADLRSRGADGAHYDFEPEVLLELRYKGQEHTLTVPGEFKDGGLRQSADEFYTAFIEQYEEIFGSILEGWPMEIVTMRAALICRMPRGWMEAETHSAASVESGGEVQAYSFTLGESTTFPVIARDSIAAGDELAGPVIIVEPTSTIYVDHGYSVTAGAHGCLFINEGDSA